MGDDQVSDRILDGVSRYHGDGGVADILLFAQEAASCRRISPLATFGLTEAYSFRGPLVATTVATAATALRCPAAAKRLFYAWDLEWVRSFDRTRPPLGMSCEQLAAIYRSPDLTLIARSDSHREVIERCWNVHVRHVVDDFDFTTLLGII